jgi:hypothetical protein
MLRLLDGATQLKDATAHATGCDCGANAGSAKPSCGEECFLDELETTMK